MLFKCHPSLLNERSQAFLPHKHVDHEFSVVPGGVAKQLVDRVDEAFGAGPELALTDEEVSTIAIAHEDVRSTLSI